jgi:hypothetical protein
MLRKLSILPLVALVAAACSTEPTLHLIQNAGFETGNFASWTTFDAASGDTLGFLVTASTVLPESGDTVLAPPEGAYAAITDQNGPGTHVLYQDVILPPNRTATLRAIIYLQSDADWVNAATAGLASDAGESNQQVRVDVMNPTAGVTDVGAGVLLNVYRTQPGDSLVTGYKTLTADLSGFAGQSVRIRFAEVDTQGFLHLGVDSVDVEVK